LTSRVGACRGAMAGCAMVPLCHRAPHTCRLASQCGAGHPESARVASYWPLGPEIARGRQRRECCAGDGILVETLIRRIIMEKRQRSPLPANDLDSRPRLTPPVHIVRPAHKLRNLWRDTEGAFPSVVRRQPSATMTRPPCRCSYVVREGF
jgi:hypothetical protein